MEDARFRRFMDEYEEVDKEVFRMEKGIETPEDAVLTAEKKKRLSLKDQLASMLQDAAGNETRPTPLELQGYPSIDRLIYMFRMLGRH